jgi:hypothetical protein
LSLLVDGYLIATVTVTLDTLKFDGLIAWPWWAVVSPLWGGPMPGGFSGIRENS